MSEHVENVAQGKGLAGVVALLEVVSQLVKEKVSLETDPLLLDEDEEEKIDGRKNRKYWLPSEDQVI